VQTGASSFLFDSIEQTTIVIQENRIWWQGLQ